MKSLRGALVGALGVLLGLQALRTFLSGLVWMIGEELHPIAMGVIALGVGSFGFFSGTIRSQLGLQRTERFSSVGLTALYVASLYATDTPLRVGLAAAATIVWIWWFSTFVCGRRLLALALVGGFSLDVFVHAFFHGLDLPIAGSILGAGLIGALFISAPGEPEPEEHCPGWGILAIAPWLFVQLEVLTNLGRIRVLTGTDLAGAVLLAEVGLAVAVIAMSVQMPGLLRAALGLLAALSLIQPVGFAWLLLAQAGLSAALVGALKPGRPWLWSPITVMLMFGLFFLFYFRMTWPLLPALAAITLSAISMMVRSDWHLPALGRAFTIPLVLAGTAMLALLSVPRAGPVTSPPPPPGAIRLMTYNIHQGMDYRSMPSAERIARVIEAESPDLVALQEVNRGWMIAGASDFVSWLERRLPGYHVVYGPMVGDLWGTVILSRLPVLESGYRHFRPGIRFTTGYSWAVVDLPGCPTLVMSVHLATGRQLGGERYAQMEQLLEFWNRRPCTIIMGDTNAEPFSPTTRLMEGAGFTDWLGRHTKPRDATWPAHRPVESIDYVATTSEFEGVAARAIPVVASDHRPVVVDVLVRQAPEQ